jgi:hypothetical protein
MRASSQERANRQRAELLREFSECKQPGESKQAEGRASQRIQ